MGAEHKKPADSLFCRRALLWGWLRVLPALCFVTGVVRAQSPEPEFPKIDSLPRDGFVVPDSLAMLAPWKPDFRSMEPIRTTPAVSMTSVMETRIENRPRHIVVIDNNTLRLGRYVNVSNGQAGNWGPFPDAYLDARTLSFPMP